MSKYDGHPDQRWGHISYAQHGDDFFLLNVFDLLGITKGSYLDVGAHHPTIISNTRLLYERGWRGVNIEANPNLIGSFNKERPEDVNVCVGVADNETDLPFFMYYDDSGRNTFSDEEMKSFTASNPEHPVRNMLTLKVTTLDSIVAAYCGGKWPDLLTMDIEGLDYQALKASRFTNLDGPAVVCVEVRQNESAKFKNLMSHKGYFCLARISANLIFVNRNYDSLVL